jgi:RNA polymerase sigma-70 factor (ECF subfamily)
MTVAMLKPTSDELIERWIRGDREAAREIYEKYFRRAWKFGLAITRQEVEAEELAQEAIAHGLDVVRDSTRRPEKFTGWLLGIVKHMAWRKAGRRAQPLPLELALEDTRHGRPSVAMVDAEMTSLMRRALGLLSDGDRRLVEERFVRGTGRAEICRKLGCSLDTVDRRLKMAVARMRDFLSGHFTTLVLTGNAPTMDQVLALRPSFRAAFLARHVEGLTAGKAAEKLGIPVATLEERLRFAYESLGCSDRTNFATLRRPV